MTVTRKADVTLGADFVAITDPVMLMTSEGSVGYDDFDVAFAAAKAGDKLKVVGSGTLTTTTAVPVGVGLEVVTGVTLTVANGAILYIDGPVTVSGTIAGSVSKCTKLVQQLGDNGEPFNPYSGDEKYQVKYWKTTNSVPSIAVSGTTVGSHVTIVNGLGETVYRGASANAYVCTTDKSVALNHITGVEASYSSGTDAYNAVEKNSHNVSSTTCSLMGKAASQLVLLTANGTVSVGSSNPLNSGFIADCAGNTISFTSKQFANAANVVVINASKVTSSKLTSARLTAINCPTVTGPGTDGINSNQSTYCTSLHLYDCGTFSKFYFSNASVVMTGGTPGVCFFSGGPYGPSFTGNYHVYGGTFSVDPSDYLASNDLEAPKEGNYWVVRMKKPTIYVAKVGTDEYETLQAAVDAAPSGGTVELLAGIATDELTTPVTVAAGKTVTLDLVGYAVTAPNGAIINHGTLYLQDTSTFDVPGSLTTASGNVIVNDGTLDVTWGVYMGNIVLNGGTFTTHFGTFDGTISVADGQDPKVVANLRGGEFSNSVSTFLREGFTEVYCRKDPSDPMRYWIYQPQTVISSSTYSGADKAWKLDFLASSDLTLYKKTKNRTDHSSDEDWRRRAELYSYTEPYSGYVLDCVLIFDRDVKKETVTFLGKTTASLSVKLDKDLKANEDCPVLVRKMKELFPEASAYTYGRSIDEIGSITAGVTNNDCPENEGTVCTIDVRLSKPMSLVCVRYMLGGQKAAIDRGTSRVTFGSLAAAVDGAQSGETILVGADTAENVTLAKAGTFTIDPYGFAFTGTVTVGNGFVLKETTTSTSLAAAQGVFSVEATTYVVVSRVDTPTITASVATEVPSGGGVAVTGSVPTGLGGATYTLLKQNAAGAFEVVEGTGKTSPDFTLAETGLYQIRVTANEKTADSETIGVLKYAAPASATEQTTIVAVPWEMTLDVLLRKGDFAAAEGNKWNTAVKVYNAVNEKYEMWTLTETLTGTEWTPCEVVSTEDGKSIMTTTEAATARTLARGSAVWVTRKNASSPFYICGICPKEASASTTLASGWNLVANPLFTTFDLNSITGGANDRIIVPSATGLGQKTYTYENGAWGYMGQQEVIRNGTVVGVRNTRITTETEMAPGQGFWYVKDGTGSPAAINWTSTGTDN